MAGVPLMTTMDRSAAIGSRPTSFPVSRVAAMLAVVAARSISPTCMTRSDAGTNGVPAIPR
jgi:hypothetical protein